jgi:hypothetical protein
MHDGAADYMQIWLHAHEDMKATDEISSDRVFMWNQGVDPNDDTWILGVGNQDSSDASFGLTPWDSVSRVRFGSGTSSVGAIQAVSDFVWVQISLVLPGGAFAGSIAGSIVFDFSTDILEESDVKKIFTIEDLDAMRYDVSADYVLMNDLDFYDDASYEDPVQNKNGFISGEGWDPIGSYVDPFVGSFNGQNYTIDNLYINRAESDLVSLIAKVENATISNLGIINADIVGDTSVGILTGGTINSSILYVYATGNVEGIHRVGGLIGNVAYLSYVKGSYFEGTVQGSDNAVGGFAGLIDRAIVEASYSLGTVHNTQNIVGGFAGMITGSASVLTNVNNCYSNSDVQGSVYVGGFCGFTAVSTISDVYSTGEVSGFIFGGLIGMNQDSTILNSYWDIQNSGVSISNGGTGRTTTQMYQQSTYVGWDFEDIWFINQGVDYPRLKTI